MLVGEKQKNRLCDGRRKSKKAGSETVREKAKNRFCDGQNTKMSVGPWGANKMRLCKGERGQAGVRRAFLWQTGARRPAALAAIALLVCLCAPFAGCGKAEEERAQYCIEAVYEEGVVRARMRVEAESGGELRFNLYGNAYREGAAYPPVAAAYQKSAYYGAFARPYRSPHGHLACGRQPRQLVPRAVRI